MRCRYALRITHYGGVNAAVADTNDQVPNTLSLAFVEGLYDDFLHEPASVPADWRRYFEQVSNGDRFAERPRLEPAFAPASVFNPPAAEARNGKNGKRPAEAAVLQERVDMLIRAYRVRGHMVASIDPLGRPRPAQPELDPAIYGLT